MIDRLIQLDASKWGRWKTDRQTDGWMNGMGKDVVRKERKPC